MSEPRNPTSAQRLERLSISNEVPSDADRTYLQPIYLEAQEAVIKSDDEIARLEYMLAGLKKSHVTIIHRRLQLATILSPLRFFPQEILGTIFGYACERDSDFVLRISAVCRLWRFAALANSELWTTILPGHQENHLAAKNYISTFIARARKRAMTLIFDEVEDYFACREALRQELAGCCWRSVTWTAVKFDALYPIFVKETIAALMASSAQTLESVTINHQDIFRAKDNTWDMCLAHGLKNFSFVPSDPLAFDNLLLPWAQLTRLSLESSGHTGLDYFDVLRQCVNHLQECILKLPYNDELDESKFSVIVFPMLRKLHLYISTFDIISFIDAPSLEDLLLHLTLGEEEVRFIGNTDSLEWLTGRMVPHLKKLSIGGTALGEGDLESIIASSIAIQELTIIIPRDPLEDVLDMITVHSDAVVHLPNLEVFKLICDPSAWTQEVFLEFSRSRWWPDGDDILQQRPCARLRQAFLMQIQEEKRLSWGDEVRQLRREGLDINILTPSRSHLDSYPAI